MCIYVSVYRINTCIFWLDGNVGNRPHFLPRAQHSVMGCRCVLLDSSFPFPEVATWRWRNVSRFSKGTVRGCRSVWSCLEKEATRSRGWFILNVGYRWYTPWIESNSCEITRTPLLVGRWSLWFVHLFPSIYFSRLIDQIIPLSFQKYFGSSYF